MVKLLDPRDPRLGCGHGDVAGLDNTAGKLLYFVLYVFIIVFCIIQYYLGWGGTTLLDDYM